MNEIECQGEGCGRMAEEVDEDYYACGRCGWAGSENNPVVVLEKQVEELGYIIETFSAVRQRVRDLEGMNRNLIILMENLEKQRKELLSDLSDCHYLLNDCGFFYEGGTWVDGDNREGEE